MLDNVRGLDEILRRRAEGDRELVNALEDRATNLAKEQQAADRYREEAEREQRRAERDARVAEAARRQAHHDNMRGMDEQDEEREEEAGQLTRVLGADDPGLLTHGQPEPPQPPPPAPADAGDDNDKPEPPARRNNADPRNWGRRPWPWILAIIGAIIGTVIARVTYGPMWSVVTVSGLHVLLVILWVIVLIAAGFFSGGAIGCTIEERRERDHRQH